MVRGRQSHPKIGVSHHAAICIQKAFRGYAHRVVYKRAVVNAERMKYRLLMRISEQDARVAQLTEQNKSFRMMVESMAPVLAPGMQVSLESARFCEDGQHRHLILGKDGNAAINIDECDGDSYGEHFFTVVNAGNNLVALHNAKNNRFLRLSF